MKNIYLSFIAMLLITSGLSAQKSSLVDAQWVQKRMESGNLVIFHIGREEGYKDEHIEGAIYIEPSEYTYQDDVRVFDLPTDQELKDVLENKGLSNSKDVIIYTPKNWIPLVTRLYFTLDYLGHGGKTYILDGGLVAWKAINGKVSSRIPEVVKGSFEIKPNMNLLASKEEVLAGIESEEVDIVDCRAQVYYSAIEATHGARKGRVPGAKT
ncbi:MAG: rhodanese-like domain-containing protein, partial [Cyclobacteriaceae bacterium]